MSGSFIDITNAQGDTYKGYFAQPESGAGPGVVVIQEIFGLNDFIRQTVDALAGHGYMAVAPDLFWRLEADVALGYGEDDMARAFDLYGRFDAEGSVVDIQGAIDAVRARSAAAGASGKVGCVGFCLGGLLAWLTATRTDVDAAVSYYGVGIEGYLGEAAAVSAPTILHIAAADSFVPVEAQAQLAEMAQGHGAVEAFSYAGCDHAFATPGRDSFDAEATRLSVERSLGLFERALG